MNLRILEALFVASYTQWIRIVMESNSRIRFSTPFCCLLEAKDVYKWLQTEHLVVYLFERHHRRFERILLSR